MATVADQLTSSPSMRKNRSAQFESIAAKIARASSEEVHSIRHDDDVSVRAAIHFDGEMQSSAKAGCNSRIWYNKDRRSPMKDFCSLDPGLQKKCDALITGFWRTTQGDRRSPLLTLSSTSRMIVDFPEPITVQCWPKSPDEAMEEQLTGFPANPVDPGGFIIIRGHEPRSKILCSITCRTRLEYPFVGVAVGLCNALFSDVGFRESEALQDPMASSCCLPIRRFSCSFRAGSALLIREDLLDLL